MTEMLDFVAAKNYEKLVDYLSNEINKLISIGADYVALASNTPHLVIDKLAARSSVPLISIVDETCKYAKNMGAKKLLLTGTLFTMQINFYKKAFEKYNIECIVPDDSDKAAIHEIVFPNLEDGLVFEKDKREFLKICNTIIKNENVDGIILGCTELPLLVGKDDFDIEVIDTMDVHIKSIVNKIFESSGSGT